MVLRKTKGTCGGNAHVLFVSLQKLSFNKEACKMSKPVITVVKSKSGKTYRETLCSMSLINRKRQYFVIEELRRGRSIKMTQVGISASNERMALEVFRELCAQRDYIENGRSLFSIKETAVNGKMPTK